MSFDLVHSDLAPTEYTPDMKLSEKFVRPSKSIHAIANCYISLNKQEISPFLRRQCGRLGLCHRGIDRRRPNYPFLDDNRTGVSCHACLLVNPEIVMD
ncbi:unnamed protein product [Rotaria sordida]|uniref:Uncharacterized protein n=1 Tax=Rotaria sordida TaxID=392033 RepID=A0A814UE23_9BILA|nr:unnamed protein product [Rotaria sordida]